MNAVVDTNVIAYHLLGTEPFTVECRDFWKRNKEAMAPGLWQAELLNVLWMAERAGILSVDDATDKLRLAARLGIRSVPARQLWRGALIRSIQSGVSAYDTLFIELAARRKLRLATFDTLLLKTFPDIAKRPSNL